jgi:hypothetical protein
VSSNLRRQLLLGFLREDLLFDVPRLLAIQLDLCRAGRRSGA